MAKKEKRVPLREAAEQVRITGVRLALMHLAFSKVLVEELGEKKGKETIVKAMIEYGRRVGERNKAGHQDLPFYGFHDTYRYGEEEFVDVREKTTSSEEEFDYSRYRVHGCILAKTFREYGEQELGCLYCYVDAAKSMASDPDKKLTHTACEVIGDGYCAFQLTPTTDEERIQFKSGDTHWAKVDPILIKGSKMDKDRKP